jgi:integrase
MAAGRQADAPLFVTATGHVLHATAVERTLDRAVVARRRRIHDLRHTAACLWLARGVDPSTVQAWMGHASIATTNLYLHHLGTPADRAGLDRLNATGYTGVHEPRSGTNDDDGTPPGQERSCWSDGVPVGWS